MNCNQVHLDLDDYLDNRLAPEQRRRLEVHLSSCPNCVAELSRRSAFERTVAQAVGAWLQRQRLPAQSSATLIREAQRSLRQGIRARRLRSAAQTMARLAALALVLAGLSALLGHLPLPSNLHPLALFPVRPPLPPSQRPLTIMPEDPLDSMGFRPMAVSADNPAGPPSTAIGGLTLLTGPNLIEPQPMYPGDAFTVTLLVQNDTPQAKSVQIDLEINGPSGHFRFPLSLRSPVPARGASLLRVTSKQLASLCLQRYLLPPTAIFSLPGVYRVRVTLSSPAAKPEQ